MLYFYINTLTLKTHEEKSKTVRPLGRNRVRKLVRRCTFFLYYYYLNIAYKVAAVIVYLKALRMSR